MGFATRFNQVYLAPAQFSSESPEPPVLHKHDTTMEMCRRECARVAPVFILPAELSDKQPLPKVAAPYSSTKLPIELDSSRLGGEHLKRRPVHLKIMKDEIWEANARSYPLELQPKGKG